MANPGDLIKISNLSSTPNTSDINLPYKEVLYICAPCFYIESYYTGDDSGAVLKIEYYNEDTNNWVCICDDFILIKDKPLTYSGYYNLTAKPSTTRFFHNMEITDYGWGACAHGTNHFFRFTRTNNESTERGRIKIVYGGLNCFSVYNAVKYYYGSQLVPVDLQSILWLNQGYITHCGDNGAGDHFWLNNSVRSQHKGGLICTNHESFIVPKQDQGKMYFMNFNKSGNDGNNDDSWYGQCGNPSSKSSDESECITWDTQILLANGEQKRICDLQYTDLLLVWDQYRGKFCAQFPNYIKKPEISEFYLKMTLQDGTIIKIIQEHNFYDMANNIYLDINSSNYNKLDFNTIQLAQYKNGALAPVKIKSIEMVKEQTLFYTIYSSGTMTYFANNMLCGVWYMNLMGKINWNHINDLSFFNQIKSLYGEGLTIEECRKKYGNVYSSVYYGNFVNLVYVAMQSGLIKELNTKLSKGYDKMDNNASSFRFFQDLGFWQYCKPLPMNDQMKEMAYIKYLYKDGSYSDTYCYKIGEEIQLPFKCYSVAEIKEVENKYTIRLNTILEEL